MANQQDTSAKQQTSRQLGEVILKAWTDPAFKQRLESNPNEALKEAGVSVPEGVEVKVLEENENVNYLVIPQKPGNLQVSDFRSADASWCWSYNAIGCF